MLDINDPVSCPQFVAEMMQMASRVYCVLMEHDGELSRAELVSAIDNLQIEGFRRRTAYEFIKVHLALPNPQFRELNGKMVITRS